jgi:polyhydroxybutyrate depolymerase
MAGQGRARRFVVLAAAACLLVAGCAQPGADRGRPDRQGNGTAPPPPSPPPPPPSPPPLVPPLPPDLLVPHGRIDANLTVNGTERTFVVHVARQVTALARAPVVLMLHGSGGDGGEFYNRSGWVEKAEAEGLIAVFPTALRYCYGEDDDHDGNITGGEYRVGSKWASGKLGTSDLPLCSEDRISRFPAARQAEIQSRTVLDDVAYFDALVAWLRAELPADAARMYVTGFSNGGSMAGRLMVERADTFAAFAMTAGGPTVPGLAARPAHAWFSIGERDPGFIQATGVGPLPLNESFLDIPAFRAMADTIAANARVNATQYQHEQRAVQGKTLSTFRFNASLVGASNAFVLVVMEDVTHQYPNGDNHPVRMTELLWPFFRGQALG